MRARFLVAVAILMTLAGLLLSACGESDGAATSSSTMPGELSTTGPASADGATLLQDRCTACHTLDRVTAERQDQAWWEGTVARMVDRGARLTETEQTTLIAYLAETYAP